MRISVIVPCHNAGPWIAGALRSAASQTYSPYEIIVIDDDSTDNSLEQINDSGVSVKLIQVKARNAAAARNAGIAAATGDWIALLDADDKWYPNHLFRAVKLLRNTNDVAFMSNHDWIGLRDELLPRPDATLCKLGAPRSGMDINDFLQIWQQGFHFGHSTVLYRRDCLCEVGMYDCEQRRRHDIDLWLRMIAGRTWTYDTTTQVGYRENTPGSLSKDVLECDYYYLRALVKNLPPDARLYRKHLRRSARAAMGIAFTHGSTEQYDRIRRLASSHLSPIYKFAYVCASVWPGLIRQLINSKRRLLMSEVDSAHTRSLGEVIGALATAAMAVVLTFPRQRAYRRLLNYHPSQDSVSGFAGSAIKSVPVRYNERGILIEMLPTDVVSCVLELGVRASLVGTIFDPSLEIAADGYRDVQYLERGVRGIRFFNLTRLIGTMGSNGGTIKLTGRDMRWLAKSARLHLCSERLAAADRILVIAPHPDDAEIAAFGLYADTNATVVTLTAGDATSLNSHLSRTSVAKVRVLNSITVPQYGDVCPERAINLCLPDGRLAEMYKDPHREFGDLGQSTSNVFADLRKLNRSSLLRDDSNCSWASLVRELRHVIAQTKPTIIVTPHPWLDPHPDHICSTAAVCQALEATSEARCRFFLYTVHNRRSELWPFGPAGSGVALLPVFSDDIMCASGFYSHSLSTDRQRDKFLALEAMYDIRNIEWPTSSPTDIARRRLCAELRGLAHGMGSNPTSYLRRAVRPDEFFFVTSFTDAMSLTRRSLAAKTR
jgi:glycosyltransferase involved in cell wall biosynthesis/LmbE family N-acetylglucosaminyl deacetylase